MRFYKVTNNLYNNPILWKYTEIKSIKLFKYKGNLLCYFKKNETQYNGFIVCKDCHIVRQGYVATSFLDAIRNLFGLPEKRCIENLPF